MKAEEGMIVQCPGSAQWGVTAEDVMAIWPVTGAVVFAEASSYPSRRVLHRCDQGDFAARIDLQATPVGTEQRLAVLDHLASWGFRHAPALLRSRHGRERWRPATPKDRKRTRRQ